MAKTKKRKPGQDKHLEAAVKVINSRIEELQSWIVKFRNYDIWYPGALGALLKLKVSKYPDISFEKLCAGIENKLCLFEDGTLEDDPDVEGPMVLIFRDGDNGDLAWNAEKGEWE